MNYDWKRFVDNVNRTITVLPIKLEGCVAEYQDARSAAFFAMGMSIKQKEPITLLVPGEYTYKYIYSDYRSVVSESGSDSLCIL